jgi:uncharacterized protein (UPF0210 family)
MLPAGFHDLTPVHELAYELPEGARLLGDNAFNSAADEGSMLQDTGVRLVPVRRVTMKPHAWFLDDSEVRDYRHTIETVNSQREKMGVEQLYARTHVGFDRKVHASRIALICTNMNEQSRYVVKVQTEYLLSRKADIASGSRTVHRMACGSTVPGRHNRLMNVEQITRIRHPGVPALAGGCLPGQRHPARKA